jgi:hypothetical protein
MNIKMSLKKKAEGVEWIEQARDTDRWQKAVSTAMKLRGL